MLNFVRMLKSNMLENAQTHTRPRVYYISVKMSSFNEKPNELWSSAKTDDAFPLRSAETLEVHCGDSPLWVVSYRPIVVVQFFTVSKTFHPSTRYVFWPPYLIQFSPIQSQNWIPLPSILSSLKPRVACLAKILEIPTSLRFHRNF